MPLRKQARENRLIVLVIALSAAAVTAVIAADFLAHI
jgi:hypothetical protein